MNSSSQNNPAVIEPVVKKVSVPLPVDKAFHLFTEGYPTIGAGAQQPLLLLANNGPQTYGGMYAANEAIGGDWADHWLPQDSSGNIYRAVSDIPPPEFNYRGKNQNSYTNTWFKESNVSEDDWTDLIGMLRIMGTNDLFTTDAVRAVINPEQWLSYLAVMALV